MLPLLALLLTPPAHADLPELAGAWGLEIAAVSAARVPVLGDVKSTSRTWVLLQLVPDGAGFVHEHRVCAAEVRGGLVRTRVPQGYVDAIAPKRYPAVLAADGDGWRYDADTLLYTMGYDRQCGAVPTEPDDRCVVDSDGDGKPGATVHAKAPAFPWVEVYVAQQAHPVLHGRIVDGDRVEGAVELRALQTEVLGASNALFDASPTVRPLPAESTFRMQRLTGAGGCAEVLTRFGGEPPRD